MRYWIPTIDVDQIIPMRIFGVAVYIESQN
jgi:hypothetical protein